MSIDYTLVPSEWGIAEPVFSVSDYITMHNGDYRIIITADMNISFEVNSHVTEPITHNLFNYTLNGFSLSAYDHDFCDVWLNNTSEHVKPNILFYACQINGGARLLFRFEQEMIKFLQLSGSSQNKSIASLGVINKRIYFYYFDSKMYLAAIEELVDERGLLFTDNEKLYRQSANFRSLADKKITDTIRKIKSNRRKILKSNLHLQYENIRGKTAQSGRMITIVPQYEIDSDDYRKILVELELMSDNPHTPAQLANTKAQIIGTYKPYNHDAIFNNAFDEFMENVREFGYYKKVDAFMSLFEIYYPRRFRNTKSSMTSVGVRL